MFTAGALVLTPTAPALFGGAAVLELVGSSVPGRTRPSLPRPVVARPSLGGAVKKAARAWVKPALGFAILAVLLWQVGTGAFVDSFKLIDARSLLAALVLGAVTTIASAWRWSLVANGLGARLPLGTAIADCYRSVFLNSTLPGGVLGDVHRAVSHGRDSGDVRRGIRAVVWERTVGQVVQLVLAVIVLFAFPSPVQAYLPMVTGIAVAGLVALVLAARLLPGVSLPAKLTRGLGTARNDLRDGVLAGGLWLKITVASVVAVTGHLLTFLVAARVAGVTAPAFEVVPLLLLALLAMGVPANVGGFGPREGVAAWAFGAAGLTAAQGVATGVVYGALVLAASLPGAAVLIAQRVKVPAAVRPVGAVCG